MHPKLAGKSTICVQLQNHPFPYKICLVLYLYNKWSQHLQRQRCLPPPPLADPWMKCCLMLCRNQNSVTGITTRKSKVFCTINSILCTTMPSAEMLGTAIQFFCGRKHYWSDCGLIFSSYSFSVVHSGHFCRALQFFPKLTFCPQAVCFGVMAQ